MTNYNAPRQLTVAALLVLLAACVHAQHKLTPAAPAAAPAPTTVAAPAPANPAPPMQTTAPVRYTVKKGDTLWSIASMYLKDPAAWPDIWYANPDIKNPHLIFPGDVLLLGTTAAGRPALSVERNGQVATETSPPPVASTVSAPAVAPATAVTTAVPTVAATAAAAPATAAAPMAEAPALPLVKLEPQVHYLPLSDAVPAVQTAAIRPFLTQTRIVSKNELDNAGYLLSAQNQEPAIASDTDVYARGLTQAQGGRYTLYEVGDKYVDPESGDVIGYQATYVGDAEVENWGDPQKLLLTKTVREAIAGDRLLPATEDNGLQSEYMPHRPVKPVHGQIVATLGAVQEIAQYGVVVLNRGSNDGLDPGAVLDIQYNSGKVPDPYHGGFFGSKTKLPNAQSGTLMVFRVFANASYGLVMQSSQEIHVADYVVSP